jgi:hypothetical protein
MTSSSSNKTCNISVLDHSQMCVSMSCPNDKCRFNGLTNEHLIIPIQLDAATSMFLGCNRVPGTRHVDAATIARGIDHLNQLLQSLSAEKPIHFSKTYVPINIWTSNEVIRAPAPQLAVEVQSRISKGLQKQWDKGTLLTVGGRKKKKKKDDDDGDDDDDDDESSSSSSAEDSDLSSDPSSSDEDDAVELAKANKPRGKPAVVAPKPTPKAPPANTKESGKRRERAPAGISERSQLFS